MAQSYENDITQPQQVALAIVPKFTSFLSLFGSGWIVLEVCRDKKKQRLVYHRILLSMSLIDVLHSAAVFMSTWPIPEGSPHVWGARGNVRTCEAQGFFVQLSLAVVLYNSCLAFHFFLVIKHNWSEDRLKKVEPWMHFLVLTFGIGTAVASIPLKLFNNDLLWCWIACFPLNYASVDDVSCERGKYASIFKWPFFFVPVWSVIVAVTIAMIVVYRTVRKQEDAVSRYSTGSVRGKHRNSRKVAHQGFLFVGAFLVTWIMPAVGEAYHHFQKKDSFSVLLLTGLLAPLQGFWNFFIYIRPRYLRYRGKRVRSGRISVQSFRRTVTKTLRRAFTIGDDAEDDDYQLGTMSQRIDDDIELHTNGDKQNSG